MTNKEQIRKWLDNNYYRWDGRTYQHISNTMFEEHDGLDEILERFINQESINLDGICIK